MNVAEPVDFLGGAVYLLVAGNFTLATCGFFVHLAIACYIDGESESRKGKGGVRGGGLNLALREGRGGRRGRDSDRMKRPLRCSHGGGGDCAKNEKDPLQYKTIDP